MPLTFPNESTAYRDARNALLARETELQRMAARVAEQRRALPPGGEIPEDYTVHRLGANGQAEEIHLSDLFSAGKNTLAIYSFMYGPDRETPCAGCTSLLEQIESAAGSINQDIDFVIAARSPVQRLDTLARLNGWSRLQFVSTADTTYNQDYHATTPDGHDVPVMNVFHKVGDTVRHFWSAEMVYAPEDPGQDARALDSLSSLWNMLDLTPAGRGTDWWPEVPTPRVPVAAEAVAAASGD